MAFERRYGFFKKITSEAEPEKWNAVIMGRKTWESIPEKFRPLPNRVNIIISTTMNSINHVNIGYLVFKTFDEALKWLNAPNRIDNIFVIGGAKLYNEALNHPLCDLVYVTEIQGDFECDTFIDPVIETDYRYIAVKDEIEENGIKYKFCLKRNVK